MDHSPVSAMTLERVERRRLAAVRLLATDVDGTLTTGGVLPAAVLRDLEALSEAGIEVVPVTGRSTGEALALARYLPGVRRAVAENGLVAVEPDRPPRPLFSPPDAAKMTLMQEYLEKELSIAPCAPFRMADIAFERGDRTEAALARLAERVRSEGLHATWSSVHFHLCPAQPDKGAGLRALLADERLPPGALAAIGDAPNDAGLWQLARQGGISVGTAEVRARWEWIDAAARPEFVTGPGSAGWRELAAVLLSAR